MNSLNVVLLIKLAYLIGFFLIVKNQTTYSSTFVMKTNSYYYSNASMPYTQDFSFGYVDAPGNITFHVEKNLPNGSFEDTTTQYSIFLSKDNDQSLLFDYSNQSTVVVKVNQSGSYSLKIFQYYSPIFTASELSLNRYYVSSLTKSNGSASKSYKYMSILSYYPAKHIYFGQSAFTYFNKTINIRIISSQTLNNETVDLKQYNRSQYNLFKTFSKTVFTYRSTKVTNKEYLFSFPMAQTNAGYYYLIRILDARAGQDYTITYPSDSYQCDSSSYQDKYFIYQPCTCPKYSYCVSLCVKGYFDKFNVCLTCYADAIASLNCQDTALCSQIRDSMSNLCILCANQPNSAGFINFKENRCVCIANFFWNFTTKSCETSCSNFTSDTCNTSYCLGVSFFGNNTCIYCSHGVIIKNNISQCNCTQSFWNPNSLQCDANCTNICGTGECQNTTFLKGSQCVYCSIRSFDKYQNNTLQCDCSPSGFWNPTSLQCDSNCDNICGTGDCGNYSFFVGNRCVHCTFAKIVVNFITQCDCSALQLFWNPITLQCDQNCTNSCGLGDCQSISFMSGSKCVMCQYKAIDKYHNNTMQCDCSPYGFWNPISMKCDSNCSNICGTGDCENYSFFIGTQCIHCQVAKIMVNNVSQCDCSTLGQFWNPTVNDCDANCSNFSRQHCGTGDCGNQSYSWINQQCLLSCGTAVESSCGGSSSCSTYSWNGNSCAQQSSHLGLIIGLSVGLPVPLIVLIIIICVKRQQICTCCKKEQQYQIDNGSQPSSAAVIYRDELYNDQICQFCNEGQTTLILNCGHLTHPTCYLQRIKQNKTRCPVNCGVVHQETFKILCKTCRNFNKIISMVDLASTVKTNLKCRH